MVLHWNHFFEKFYIVDTGSEPPPAGFVTGAVMQMKISQEQLSCTFNTNKSDDQALKNSYLISGR